MNRNGELRSPLSSIAMAGVEAERPSRRKAHPAFPAMKVTGIRIVAAIIIVSHSSRFESLEPSSLTGGRPDASGANPNGA